MEVYAIVSNKLLLYEPCNLQGIYKFNEKHQYRFTSSCVLAHMITIFPFVCVLDDYRISLQLHHYKNKQLILYNCTEYDMTVKKQNIIIFNFADIHINQCVVLCSVR